MLLEPESELLGAVDEPALLGAELELPGTVDEPELFGTDEKPELLGTVEDPELLGTDESELPEPAEVTPPELELPGAELLLEPQIQLLQPPPDLEELEVGDVVPLLLEPVGMGTILVE